VPTIFCPGAESQPAGQVRNQTVNVYFLVVYGNRVDGGEKLCCYETAQRITKAALGTPLILPGGSLSPGASLKVAVLGGRWQSLVECRRRGLRELPGGPVVGRPRRFGSSPDLRAFDAPIVADEPGSADKQDRA